MGLLMKVWTAQVMTDLWGDIGYSQALRGRDPAVGTRVPYDTQEEVYRQLLAEAQAVADMATPGGVAMGGADLIYGGNMERWRRSPTRCACGWPCASRPRRPTLAQSSSSAAYNAGGFQSNADNAILWYVDNGLNRHPIHVYELGRNDHSVSGTMIDTLASWTTRACPCTRSPTRRASTGGRPTPPSWTRRSTPCRRSGPSTAGRRAGHPHDYAELLFLQAEAAERGWIAGKRRRRCTPRGSARPWSSTASPEAEHRRLPGPAGRRLPGRRGRAPARSAPEVDRPLRERPRGLRRVAADGRPGAADRTRRGERRAIPSACSTPRPRSP
jgi:hypothetical protein